MSSTVGRLAAAFHCADGTAFKDNGSHYATAVHEVTHGTRRERHLDRDFGRQNIRRRRLCPRGTCCGAGASFLCADLGITPEIREDHAAYLRHWLTVLKGKTSAPSSAQPRTHNAPPRAIFAVMIFC